jgi:hypothetical protein
LLIKKWFQAGLPGHLVSGMVDEMAVAGWKKIQPQKTGKFCQFPKDF